MLLARSGTRRAVGASTLSGYPVSPVVPRKGLSDIQQGIKTLHVPADGDRDIDIVFVPGLGAHPEESWQSGKHGFNWIQDAEQGIARDFPKARILLYQYESAWQGELKVKQFMHNIAFTLLVGLRGCREPDSKVPVVFIGHSMGGLAIAKAITITDTRRDEFSTLSECITGCVFFGTPFDGAEAASAASMLAIIGEKLDKAKSSSLLKMMSPGDAALEELKNEFLRLVEKLTPMTKLFCFYEEQPTDFAKQVGLHPLFNIAIPKKITEVVTKASATLSGKDRIGLASDHRNLVKFDSPKDTRYQLVRSQLKQIIHGSPLIAKKRFKSTRTVDRELLREVKKVLEGPDVQSIRRTLQRNQTALPWLSEEQEYKDWIPDARPDQKRIDTIWIRGQVGRGKTSNVLTVLNDLDVKLNAKLWRQPGSGQPPLLVYFFCDRTADNSTAEDVLRSFLRQLVEQQEMLVSCVKHFVKEKGKDDSEGQSKTSFQLTIENMWQSIQDMLYDEFVGSTVFFVINHLHLLPQEAPSTQKLLEYIRNDMTGSAAREPRRAMVRWLVSSRKVDHLTTTLGSPEVRLIDLEDEKYEDQVQKDLKKHAYEKVSALRREKSYDRDVAYFAHSLIGKRAQNKQWIDIACLQLKALSPNDSRRRVRQILDTMPQDLDMLLTDAWQQVFRHNIDLAEKLKDMLRAMVLTFEDPKLSELGILAGISENDDETTDLRQLVEMCKPLLTVTRRRDGESEVRVEFMSIVVKTHLLENSDKLLGLPRDEFELQHGMMAFRAFKHLAETLSAVVVPEEVDQDAADGDEGQSEVDEDDASGEVKQAQNSTTHPTAAENHTNANSYDNEEDESEYSDDDEADFDEESEFDGDNPEAMAVRDVALSYTIKYWLRHAGDASKEIAEDLVQFDVNGFWSKDSQLRRRWLFEFTRLDGRLSDMPFLSHSGLHIAASVGFPDLVSALIRNGHEQEIRDVDEWSNTPLHLAAYYDQVDIVDVLLEAGAEINHGKENGVSTPLHMAANNGSVKVMKMLIARGADVDAFDDDDGPVINSAINSGNREAVETLIKSNAKLTMEGHDDVDDIYPPLATAAQNSDASLFDYLVSACANKLPAEEYSKALIVSAEAGQIEAFKKLMAHNHSQDTHQRALDAATEEAEWDIVKIMLDQLSGLNCHSTFVQASTAWEDQSDVMFAIRRHTNHALPLTTINEALYEATDDENETNVRLLLDEFGADPNATAPANKPEDEQSFGDALTAAAYDGTIGIVKLLLDKGARIDNGVGWPLQAAAAQGHLEVVQELLDRRADVNAIINSDILGEGTALQAACEYSQADIVELLLQHHADPNLGGGVSVYPLIATSAKGDEQILELLLKAGAHVNVYGGSDHTTPLINAAMRLPVESVKLLLEAGAEINASNAHGDSALIAAALQDDVACVEFLLERGADIMHTNDADQNALQVAFEEESQDCVRVLIDAVAQSMRAIKTAIDGGNMAVAEALRGAGYQKTAKVADPETDEVQDGSVDHSDTMSQSDAESQGEAEFDEIQHRDTEDTPKLGASAVPRADDTQIQQNLAGVNGGIDQAHEGNRWRDGDTTPPMNNSRGRDPVMGEYSARPSISPRPAQQRPRYPEAYTANQNESMYTQPVVRRKPMQGTSTSHSWQGDGGQRIPGSAPLITADQFTNHVPSNSFNAGATEYNSTATYSQNNATAYQAYSSHSRTPTPQNVYQDYSAGYTSPPSQQQYRPYANPSLSGIAQPQIDQQPNKDYERSNTSNYGSNNWAPPALPPRLEERRSSTNLFGVRSWLNKPNKMG